MLGMFLLTLVSAVETETYKVNTPINLQFLCQIDNAIPSASATFNISITDQEGNNVVTNNLTQALGSGEFNYTYTFFKVETYTVKMFCSDGSSSYSSEGKYNITPSGYTQTLGFYFLILILSIGIIVFGYLIEDEWVVMLGSFVMIFFGLYILFYGIDGLKDLTYTWAIGIIILMMGVYFTIRAGFEKMIPS